MPYYTRKGTSKKDKGKTCVYKKEDNTKVGCTAGPIEKYLGALHASEKMNESEGLEWISEIGDDIENFVKELSKLIKQHVPTAELELDWDTTSGGGEYFGRIWLYDTFYELYKYGKTFTVRFYRLDPETDEYHQFDSYEDLPQTRLLTILLNDMINVNKKNLSESEESDIDWLKGPAQLKYKDLIYDLGQFFKEGDTIHLTGELYLDSEGIRIITLNRTKVIVEGLVGKRLKVYFGEEVRNHPLWISEIGSDCYTTHLGDMTQDYEIIVELPEKNINESEEDDWSWAREITPRGENEIIVGDFYNIYGSEGDIRYSLEIIEVPDSEDGTLIYEIHETVNEDDEPIGSHMETTLKNAKRLVNNKYWVLMGDDFHFMKESVDLEWIKNQEPENFFDKNKKYVVDVTNLPPAPMRYSHDTSLTKQDILKKFKELGYNVSYINVEEAKYFYLEPTKEEYSWEHNEEGEYIKYDYWVDYNTHQMTDPTYSGNYQMINVDELMFLVNNGLVKESEDDFKWIRDIMGTPMSVCDAADSLEPGNIIMIDKLATFGGHKDDVVTNVTAEVLTINYLKQIQPSNSSNLKTILVHVNDDYIGFDEDWVNYFEDEQHRKKCLDRRCMFLICGGEDFEDTTVTLMNYDLSESKKPINEVAGISFEVRDWSNIVYDEIMANPEEKKRIIIDGYDHPEVFDRFPIDYVVVDFHDKITGYDHVRSGYDKDGNYVVILFIQPQLIQGIRGYDLKSGLNHEFKHAYEDYQRRSKGKTNIDQTKESKDFYTQDFIKLLNNQQIVGPIKDVLKYYYYVSNIEKSAFLENVYDNNPEYEVNIRDIVSKDFESFKNRYDLDMNWHLVNVAYDIPLLKKFKSPRDFIDYSAKFLRQKALKILKKINKMKYIHGKLG